MGGIYQIRNIINNKIYIGSTHNFHERKQKHFRQLRQNQHHSILLQRAYNKYGEENFVFEIIEECSQEELLSREQFYLDLKKPFAPEGYNVSRQASNCVLFGEDNGMYGKLGEDNPNFGRKNTQETKDKISQAQKGKPKNPESIKKAQATIQKQYQNGRESGFLDHHHTTEVKEIFSMQHSKPVKQLDKDSLEVINIFINGVIAQRMTGISNATIGKCCNHKLHYNTAGGYKWEFATWEEYNNYQIDHRND